MVQVKIGRAWPRCVGLTGIERPWPSISLRKVPSLPTGSKKAAAEAFLEHEFDRIRSWQRLRESELEERRDSSDLGDSTVEDPSRRPPDARAVRVFFFTGVGRQR
jgi:hypothetical protein